MTVTLDEIIAAALLKFGRIDDQDITLLMSELKRGMDVTFPNDGEGYFLMSDGTVLLQQKYINQINNKLHNDETFNKQTEAFLDKINGVGKTWFMLMKIKMLGLGCVLSDDLSSSFNKVQLGWLKRLYEQGYIVDYSHQDTYGAYMAVKLTKKGEVCLFMLDKRDELDKYFLDLSDRGYDSSLVPAYLITLDLEEETVDSVLDVDRFLKFCDEYDISPVMDEKNGYSRVRTYL